MAQPICTTGFLSGDSDALRGNDEKQRQPTEIFGLMLGQPLGRLTRTSEI